MSIPVRNIIRFFLLLAVQVLLNKITLRWWSEPMGFPVFVPYIYPLFILLLPFETPVWLLLVLGFVTGISVDALMNTGGMHAAATVLLAYLRTNTLNALLPRPLNEYSNRAPGVKTLGWIPFLTYAGFLILVHHLVYFSIEFWSFYNIGLLSLKIIASATTTLLLVIAYLLLFTRQVEPRV